MRFLSLVPKTLQLMVVGSVAGLGTAGLSHLAIAGHKKLDSNYEPSYDPPSISKMAMGWTLFCGLHVHLRYQILGGVDRYFFDHSNYLWSYLMAMGICRVTTSVFCEGQRLKWTGLSTLPTRAVQLQRKLQTYAPPVTSNIVPAPPTRKVTKTKGFELTMSNT